MAKMITALTLAAAAVVFMLPACMSNDMNSHEHEHLIWLQECIKEGKSAKPGMLRSHLLKQFEIEAGLQSALPTRYVLKKCPLIKIEVTFTTATGKPANTEEKDLRVATVSPLYLDYVICD